jgi:hypothetical protein
VPRRRSTVFGVRPTVGGGAPHQLDRLHAALQRALDLEAQALGQRRIGRLLGAFRGGLLSHRSAPFGAPVGALQAQPGAGASTGGRALRPRSTGGACAADGVPGRCPRQHAVELVLDAAQRFRELEDFLAARQVRPAQVAADHLLEHLLHAEGDARELVQRAHDRRDFVLRWRAN